jgi:hypothetical protein
VRRGERLAKRARLEADTEANIQYVRNWISELAAQN